MKFRGNKPILVTEKEFYAEFESFSYGCQSNEGNQIAFIRNDVQLFDGFTLPMISNIIQKFLYFLENFVDFLLFLVYIFLVVFITSSDGVLILSTTRSF